MKHVEIGEVSTSATREGIAGSVVAAPAAFLGTFVAKPMLTCLVPVDGSEPGGHLSNEDGSLAEAWRSDDAMAHPACAALAALRLPTKAPCVSSPLLARLIAGERTKRLFAVGAVVTTIAAGWMLVERHASQIVAATCVVEAVPGTPVCAAVRTREDGLKQESAREACGTSRKGELAVGDRLPCWYFEARPERLLLQDPRPALRRSRAPQISFSLGLLLLAAAVAVSGRARERGASVDSEPGVGTGEDHPYRARGNAAPDAPTFGAIVSSTGLARWALGLPMIVLGGSLTGMLLHLALRFTGPVEPSHLLGALLGPVVLALGLGVVSYRSGIVVDTERGLLWSWQGPWHQRWLRRYHALDDVRFVAAKSKDDGEGGTRQELEIVFTSGAARRFRMADARPVRRRLEEVLPGAQAARLLDPDATEDR